MIQDESHTYKSAQAVHLAQGLSEVYGKKEDGNPVSKVCRHVLCTYHLGMPYQSTHKTQRGWGQWTLHVCDSENPVTTCKGTLKIHREARNDAGGRAQQHSIHLAYTRPWAQCPTLQEKRKRKTKLKQQTTKTRNPGTLND